MYSKEQTLMIPVKKYDSIITPEVFANKIAYRINNVCDLNYVVSFGKPFLIFLRFENKAKDHIYKEETDITISKCIVNYIKKNDIDPWEKAVIEFEFNNKTISFEGYARFKGEIINVINRN
jgi:hypothetical protein